LNAIETDTLTATAPTLGSRRASALRRAPAGSLVLAQSWVPVSVSRPLHSDLRQSTLRAAQAFTLLSSELATRRGEAKPPTA
jgi:hypothetical protein